MHAFAREHEICRIFLPPLPRPDLPGLAVTEKRSATPWNVRHVPDIAIPQPRAELSSCPESPKLGTGHNPVFAWHCIFHWLGHHYL